MATPENRPASDSRVSDAVSRARILVVEDQEDVRGLLVTALEIEGHEVDEAPNARQGLEQLQKQRYNLVLSDFAMPGGTGTWMLYEAERLGCLHDTPALIVTAHPDARELSNRAVIAKPLDLDLFLDQVRRVLRETAAGPRRPADSGDHTAQGHRVELVLYVSPNSPASAQARRNLEHLLAQFDSTQIKYTICDLVRDPAAGEQDRVAFTPTLVKRYPAPRTWVLGNLRESEIVGDLLRVCGVDAKT
jgi:two-component system response regulator GlrR